VLRALPYLKAIGVDIDSVRRVDLIESVKINKTVHPGIPGGMPSLCEAEFVVDIQVSLLNLENLVGVTLHFAM
jgi:hypothetical protein